MLQITHKKKDVLFERGRKICGTPEVQDRASIQDCVAYPEQSLYCAVHILSDGMYKTFHVPSGGGLLWIVAGFDPGPTRHSEDCLRDHERGLPLRTQQLLQPAGLWHTPV